MPYRQTERTKERRGAREKLILGAAKKLFITQGYQATTMKQIVAEAETSIGNCYFYFKNKGDLLLAIVNEFNLEIGQLVDDAIATTPTGPGQLAVAVYVGIVATLKQANLARQILVEATNPVLRSAIITHFTDRTNYFFATNPPWLSDVDTELVAHAWQGALFNILERTLANKAENDPDRIGRFLARWNLQALGLTEQAVNQAVAAIDEIAQT